MEPSLLISEHHPHFTRYLIFHDSLDKVFKAFCNLDIQDSLCTPVLKITKVKRKTSLDDEGNEITYSDDKITFTLKIEKVFKSTHYYSITMRCINCPPKYSTFTFIYKFYWDTNQLVSIVQGIVLLDDSSLQMMSIFKDNNLHSYQTIENFLHKQHGDLIETESITIANTLDRVWEFIIENDNLSFFFPFQNISITLTENNIIVISDSSSKNELKLRKTEIIEHRETKRALQLELFYSLMPMPKQLITIQLIRLSRNNTFMIFKHQSLEYIPYDVLISNSAEKKKILRKIKKTLDITS